MRAPYLILDAKLLYRARAILGGLALLQRRLDVGELLVAREVIRRIDADHEVVDLLRELLLLRDRDDVRLEIAERLLERIHLDAERAPVGFDLLVLLEPLLRER